MRRRHGWVVLGALLAALAPAAARAQAQAPTLPFTKYTLPNGLTVILSEDHRLPLVAVNVWYHVGPVQEATGRTGFAHLFEHMMFQGSKHVPARQISILEAAGASSINGTTDFDRTNYFETMPRNQLALALWLESDRMGFLADAMSPAKLENQRAVVQNERRQSVENAPYGMAGERMIQLLYPPGHPYHANVIGSHQDLEAVQLPDVVEFFRKYYAPSNASLAIVGDFDPAKARALVARYFGALPAGPKVEPVKPIPLAIAKEKRAALTDRVQLPRLYLAWLSPRIYQPGDAEADLLAKVLGGGRSSRLYQRLVYEKKIAQDVTALQYSLILGSHFVVAVTAKPGQSLAVIEREIDAVLDELRRAPIPAAELGRAKRTRDARFLRALESLGGFGGKADRLNQYEHYLGDPGWLDRDLARYRAVTATGIQDLLRTHLTRDRRVVVAVTPRVDQPATPVAQGGAK
ncbi:MAG TPA: pitrilysin family protein [Polyangia bacterium]|jgi:zinc protease